MSGPTLTYSESTGWWYAREGASVGRGKSKREARDALARMEPIPSHRTARPLVSHGAVIHAADHDLTRCGRRGDLPTAAAEADVTCGGCLRIGTSGKVRPAYPQYRSADYCPTCGLSFGHWDGCQGIAS